MSEPPKTLTLAGIYTNPLEEAVSKSSEDFSWINSELVTAVEYASFNLSDYYLITVYQRKDRSVGPDGYNVLLSVTSRSESLNSYAAKRFQEETGISLDKKVPESLKATFSLMVLPFLRFESNPAAAADFLKNGGIQNGA